MSKPAPQDGWKHKGAGAPSGSTPAGASRRPWHQGGGPAQPPPAKRRSRVWPLLFAGGFAALIITVLVAVLIPMWWKGKPPAFVFVAPHDPQSLAAPDNAAGKKTADALLATLQDTLPRASATAAPARDAWKKLAPTGGGLVLYFAAPVGADKDGPFVWLPPAKSGDGLSDADKLPVSDILKELDKHSGPKLLVFDITPAVANPAQSGVYQDFARALKEMDSQIRAVGQLCVLCSADADQRAWADERHGGTVFGHKFADGLRGAGHAANDQITARSLFEKCLTDEVKKDGVNDWAVKHREAGQTPVLLPDGDEGRARAGQIVLGVTPVGGYTPPALNPVAVNWGDLKAEWERGAELEKQAAESTDPEGWRRYLDWRSRWERLARGGLDTKDAKGQTEKARTDLEAKLLAGEYPLVSLAASARVTDARWKAADEAFKSVTTPPAKPDVWDKANDLLRKQVYERGDERPVETHLLRVFCQHLDADRARWPDPALLAAALTARADAETAAWGGDAARKHPERAFRWTRDLIRAADAERREGEDLLFHATPQAWDAAKARFNDCGPKYREATQRAKRVSEAVAARDRLFARLPYYARWVADGERALKKPTAVDDLTANVEAAARKANDLHKGLTEPPTEATAEATAQKLEQDTKEGNAALAALEKAVAAEVEAQLLANDGQAANWHALDAAAAVPFLDAKTRAELFAKLTAETNALFTKAQGTGARKTDPFQTARRHLQLARAILGDTGGVVPDKPADLRRASDDLGRRLRDCRKTADGLYKSAVVAALTAAPGTESPQAAKDRADAEVKLAGAVHEARLADPAAPVALDPDTVTADRGYWRHRFALWQAGRAIADGWANAEDPKVADTGTWYARQVAAQLVRYAKKEVALLAPGAGTTQLAQLNAACAEADALRPVKLMPTANKELVVLPEHPGVPFTGFQLAAENGTASGFPVYWLQLPERYRASNDKRGDRRPTRELTAAAVPPRVDERPLKLPTTPATAEETLTTWVLHRGHLAHTDTGVKDGGKPSLEVVHTVPPKDAAVALLAEPEAVSGAVLFLIDRSASMKYKSRTEGGGPLPLPNKTDRALDGLEAVINSLQGVNVAVAGFYYGGAGTTVNLVVAPTRVNARGRGWAQLGMDTKKSVLEADDVGETPIIDSILRVLDPADGKKFWPDDYTGARTVVVLTDGEDNKSTKAVSDVATRILRDKGDIKLHMVFFDMTAKEEEKAKGQFEPLADEKAFAPSGKLPASLHTGAKTGADFAKRLGGAFRPRLRYASNSLPEQGLLTAALLDANAVGTIAPTASGPLIGSVYEWTSGSDSGTLRVSPGDRVLVQAGTRNGKAEVFVPPAAYRLATNPDWKGRKDVPHAAGEADARDHKVYLTVPGVGWSRDGNTARKLTLTTTLERDAGGKDLTLNRPLFPWFDVAGSDPTQKADAADRVAGGNGPRMRVETRWGMTAPTWDLTLFEANANNEDRFHPKKLTGHWIDAEVLKGVEAARQITIQPTLANDQVKELGGGVSYWLREEGGKKYLLVEMPFADGERAYLKVRDWPGGRPEEQHRYYTPLRRYAVQFGPLNEEQMKREVVFDVYAVPALTAKAAAAKKAVDLTFRANPGADAFAPTGLSLLEPKAK